MAEPEAYESYPWSSVIVFNAVSVVNYLVGIYILSRVGLVWGLLFLIYVVVLEFNVIREGCRYCYYFGKRCFSGRGLCARLLFKKGDPKVFCEKQVTWKKLLPMILVLVFPTIGAAYLLIMSFDFVILGLIAIPWIIWFAGNPLIYGKLACPHCKQGRICCPANEFFSKKYGKEKK
jgi:hypothetical protein